MEEEELAQLTLDLQLLLSFAPATSAARVEPGLMSMFYVTGSYEGDSALATRIEEICDRYGINPDDVDDAELNDAEEDFA